MKLSATSNNLLFEVCLSSQALQCATMNLKKGQSSDEKISNEHPNSEQWVYVVSGSGKVSNGKTTINLKKGDLLLIEKKERHQITNIGKAALKTINFYSPPAYTRQGNLKARKKRVSSR